MAAVCLLCVQSSIGLLIHWFTQQHLRTAGALSTSTGRFQAAVLLFAQTEPRAAGDTEHSWSEGNLHIAEVLGQRTWRQGEEGGEGCGRGTALRRLRPLQRERALPAGDHAWWTGPSLRGQMHAELVSWTPSSQRQAPRRLPCPEGARCTALSLLPEGQVGDGLGALGSGGKAESRAPAQEARGGVGGRQRWPHAREKGFFLEQEISPGEGTRAACAVGLGPALPRAGGLDLTGGRQQGPASLGLLFRQVHACLWLLLWTTASSGGRGQAPIHPSQVLQPPQLCLAAFGMPGMSRPLSTDTVMCQDLLTESVADGSNQTGRSWGL